MEAGDLYFERLVKKYLIDNQRRLTLVATADPEFIEDVERYEMLKIRDLEDSLTAEQKS